ncbi:cysteine hydrolase [Actinomadura alba]|uniref:Cysteine hydrolase n=1 Tax=Actinomadura alba TaxID=406431 RepID=A0ABR7LUE3_9ACTN|nr:cysteine hydrolase [Actinomadura alba]MBC6468085.1 cysteine hydrolase [Actinomadura alba]
MSALDPNNSVVVLLDCMEGVAGGNLPDAADRERFVTAVSALVDTAAGAGVPVVRVDVEFRPGHVEVAASNSYFSGVKAAGRLEAGSNATLVMKELEPVIGGAVRVVKKRIGGFAGSDLEMVLRGLDRRHLVLGGLITRGAVLSTATEAADRDYAVTVASDACHDPDPTVHQMLLESVLSIRGKVCTVAELKEERVTR